MMKRHMRAGVSAVSRTWGETVRALGPTWAALHLHMRALMVAARSRALQSRHDRYAEVIDGRLCAGWMERCAGWMHQPLTRRLVYGGSGLAVFLLLTTSVLWWRLNSGPLSLDMATPMLTSAVEQRLGGGHRVEVGGTQLERDDNGRTALRLRDIVVRDRDGAVIASAPKAEVGLSGAGLLTGQVQATRLSLIGA